MSVFNPSGKYPRRYTSGHFLKLTKRYSTRRDRHQNFAARLMFDGLFGNEDVQAILKSISGHGLFPILIATGITITGHSAMLVRSIALVVCAIWLSVDIAVWISQRRWRVHWKSMAFSAVTTLACCAAMGIMYWFMLSTLDDQQANVTSNIVPSVSLPPSGNAWLSLFSIGNKSNFKLQSKIWCAPRMILDSGDNTFTGPHWEYGPSGTLEPNGDMNFTQCLAGVRIDTAIVCADVYMNFDYSLDTQPAIPKTKRFRFVGYSGRDKFEWYQVSVDRAASYCPESRR
jgi:hypothetical protein